MQAHRRLKQSAITAALFSVLVVFLYTYFAYAALQGESGIFRRIQINDYGDRLQNELDDLNAEISRMQNLTSRLSDGNLDLDLLDERARKTLGYIRVDEIIIN